jgi:hypothetical protein
MGTYSFYRNSKQASNCKINWDSIDTETLFRFNRLQYCYEERCETLEDVGKLLNESKLFGYLNWDIREALIELNRHLVPADSSHTPTLYFEWEGGDTAFALEFFTGTEMVNVLEYDYSDIMKDNQKLPSDEAFKLYKKVFDEIPYMDINEWNSWAL